MQHINNINELKALSSDTINKTINKDNGFEWCQLFPSGSWNFDPPEQLCYRKITDILDHIYFEIYVIPKKTFLDRLFGERCDHKVLVYKYEYANYRPQGRDEYHEERGEWIHKGKWQEDWYRLVEKRRKDKAQDEQDAILNKYIEKQNQQHCVKKLLDTYE